MPMKYSRRRSSGSEQDESMFRQSMQLERAPPVRRGSGTADRKFRASMPVNNNVAEEMIQAGFDYDYGNKSSSRKYSRRRSSGSEQDEYMFRQSLQPERAPPVRRRSGTADRKFRASMPMNNNVAEEMIQAGLDYRNKSSSRSPRNVLRKSTTKQSSAVISDLPFSRRTYRRSQSDGSDKKFRASIGGAMMGSSYNPKPSRRKTDELGLRSSMPAKSGRPSRRSTVTDLRSSIMGLRMSSSHDNNGDKKVKKHTSTSTKEKSRSRSHRYETAADARHESSYENVVVDSEKPPDPGIAMQKTLTQLRLPQGLLSAVMNAYEATDSRLWILDNSSSMVTKDAHLIGGTSDKIQKINSVSRWDELQECVTFHASMAGRVWMPTKCWLLNDPGSDMLQKFCVCWSKPEAVKGELADAKRAMKGATPKKMECSLSRQLKKLKKAVEKMEPRLRAEGKHTTIVIATQGCPTDREGNTGREVLKEYEKTLASIAKLPVKIIVRLCTDDDRVLDMYNGFDNKLDSVDCLDDFWSEALEVYLHNPWLTYGIGLHRLRESGFAPDIMDDLDERPLNLDEIHTFCETLFLGVNERAKDLPTPRKSWNAFFSVLQCLVDEQSHQWNSVKKKKMPWIDMKKLESLYAPQQQAQRSARFDYIGKSGRFGDPEGTTAQPKQSGKRSPQDISLTQILQDWSHQQNSKKLYPLGRLLTSVPSLFPPLNPKVEDHEYFNKWKSFDADAFEEEGDALKELLKRATRKAKFFLHPDKLPKDLTENQTLLLKTIWDVLQESEAATLE